MQADEKLLRECLAYFRERPVFRRLLAGFWEKYLSYGRFAGRVTVQNLSDAEREDLEGFLQRNYHGKKSASVSAERFERALAESRFAGISGRDVLELYFRKPPEGRRSLREREKQQEKHRWQQLLAQARKEISAEKGQGQTALALKWLGQLEAAVKEDDYGRGFPLYLKKRSGEAEDKFRELERLLRLSTQVLETLPAAAARGGQIRYRYLAVYAAEVTGNPHAFDRGTRDGAYLELLIRWYLGETGKEPPAMGEAAKNPDSLFPALSRQRLYLQAGLLRDDMSNYAMAAGIRARKRDGKTHEGMEGFYAEGEPVQIPLSVIVGWEAASCPENRLYIVENPSVYAILCGKWKKNCGLMCMNGQPRLSSLLILDLLAQSGTEIWYGGDFDPEGLWIAQKLKWYYRGSFHFWHMSAEDYEGSRSGEEISEKRRKMLDKITDEKLRQTAQAIQACGRAGYQENIAAAYQLPEKFPCEKGGIAL